MLTTIFKMCVKNEMGDYKLIASELQIDVSNLERIFIDPGAAYLDEFLTKDEILKLPETKT